MNAKCNLQSLASGSGTDSGSAEHQSSLLLSLYCENAHHVTCSHTHTSFCSAFVYFSIIAQQ